MKPNISEDKGLFKTNKSYTPEEIFAAGGTTAFVLKMGKTPAALVKALKSSAPIEPFTDEEWANLMEQVAKDK